MRWTQHMDGHEHALDATILWKMNEYRISGEGIGPIIKDCVMEKKAIPAPCPQVAEDEFLPQHIDLRRFRLHARKLLRTSFYRSTLTSASFSLQVFSAMAKEFVNGFVHQNGIAIISRNPPKGKHHFSPERFRLHARKLLRTSFYRSTLTSGTFTNIDTDLNVLKKRIETLHL
ncbi:hypothetical protein JHK87_027696 [Glycine soja]|nr:hypothetical protein JHK87_027696 [Glycine soja]